MVVIDVGAVVGVFLIGGIVGVRIRVGVGVHGLEIGFRFVLGVRIG